MIHEPAPKPGEEKVLDAVLADLTGRAEQGREKYGTYLMTLNGRDPLVDAYQEALDLVMYLKQELMERAKASRIGICDGCGSIIRDADIEPYGVEFCHVVPVEGSDGEPEPSPCGPVTIYHEIRRKA